MQFQAKGIDIQMVIIVLFYLKLYECKCLITG